MYCGFEFSLKVVKGNLEKLGELGKHVRGICVATTDSKRPMVRVIGVDCHCSALPPTHLNLTVSFELLCLLLIHT